MVTNLVTFRLSWDMRVISRRRLREFWKSPAGRGAEQPLRAWFQEAETASWRGPFDVKRAYPAASILKNGRVVFNIGGNKYRLVAAVRYDPSIVFIRFVGNHAQYDHIDAQEV
jgi:mRNA interferase HigB